MGCRPSRHALGKVGDSTWEYNRAFMHDVDKKKPKSKKSGRGRGRKNPTYNDFSSTSKTYFNNSESKSSKITVRLSTDGSTLEIETFDVEFSASTSGTCDVSGQNSCQDVAGNVTTVNIHNAGSDRSSRLQRCESAPELVRKISNTEPVVWKTWTKVHRSEPADEKFSCVDGDERFLSDDGTEVYDMTGAGFSGCVHVDLDRTTGAVKHGRTINYSQQEDTIATPELEEICDIFLKKTITSQSVGGYQLINGRPDFLQAESITKETRTDGFACSICRDDNPDEYILPNSCPYPDSSVPVQNTSQQSLTCAMCLMCKSRGRGRDLNPDRPSGLDTLTCLVLFSSPTGAPQNSCCAICKKTVENSEPCTDFNHCDHDGVISSQISKRACCVKAMSGCCCAKAMSGCKAGAPSVGVSSYHHEHINRGAATQIAQRATSDTVLPTSPIDGNAEQFQDAESSSHTEIINNLRSCSNCNTRNGFHTASCTRLPPCVGSARQGRPCSIELEHCCHPKNPNLNESVSMTTNDKMIERTIDRDACRTCSKTRDYNEDTFAPPRHNWTTDDLGDLSFDDCEEFFLDNVVMNKYNFDFLDVDDEEEAETEYEYESSDNDIDKMAVELQDPFDNIPTVTRAYEGYSAVFEDTTDSNSVDDDDDSSEEVFIDAVESSYV